MRPTRCGAVVAIVLTAWCASAAAKPDAVRVAAPAAPPKPLALVGGLIRTQTDAGDFVGTVVIKDRKIVALGPSVEIPADAERVDCAGHVITPGLIDARSVLGLNAAAAGEGGSTGTLNILDAVDPFNDDWRLAAAQGITAVYAQPGSGGSLGGSGAVLRVAPHAEVAVRSPAGVQALLGAAAPAAPPQDSRLSELFARFGIQPPMQQPAAPPASNTLTRYAQYETFRGLFDAARRYGENKPAVRDNGKELLLKVLKREIPVRLETAHEDDIRNVLKMAADLKLNLIFDRLDRVKSLPAELAARKDGIVLGPLAGGKISAEVRKLALDGRRFAIATYGDDPRATSWLRFHAAAAVAGGYPRDRVLRALTRDAAEMHGAGDQLGSLAVGRVADLVVFAGDPLDPATQVRLTLSQGEITFGPATTEVHKAMSVAKVTLPDPLPASFVLKTSRMLNEAGEFAPGELFVEGGRVTDLAARSSAAPVLDVGDAPVTPGLVAAYVLGSSESSPDADAGHLRGVDGLTADDAKLRGYRDAGFLTALVLPGSGNVIAGSATAVRNGDLTAATDGGVTFVLSASARSNERYPASLVGQIELIDARLRGKPSASNLYLPPAVGAALMSQRDQVLAPVRSGKATAYFETQNRAEVLAALQIVAEHRLRGVLVQPKQVDDLAQEIREAGVGVVVGSLRIQDVDRVRRGLAELAKADVPVAFGGGNAAELRTTAAWLVNAGLPRAAARRGLLAQPAEKFGLPAGTAHLAPGTAADLVIWDGDPLDLAAKPVAVITQGQRAGRGPQH